MCLEILVHIWPLCLLVNGWNFNCLAGGMFQLFLMRADLLYLWGPLKAEHGHILADELIYFFFKLSLKPVWFLKFYLLYNSTKLHPAQKNTGYIYPNYIYVYIYMSLVLCILEEDKSTSFVQILQLCLWENHRT